MIIVGCNLSPKIFYLQYYTTKQICRNVKATVCVKLTVNIIK